MPNVAEVARERYPGRSPVFSFTALPNVPQNPEQEPKAVQRAPVDELPLDVDLQLPGCEVAPDTLDDAVGLASVDRATKLPLMRPAVFWVPVLKGLIPDLVDLTEKLCVAWTQVEGALAKVRVAIPDLE